MSNFKGYITVTAAYWGFTLTDGALRMLILLHFHSLGYSPIQLAFLFIFYELMGVFTNLIGGWVASQLSLNLTLYVGLILQVVALIALSGLNEKWSTSFAIGYAFSLQGLSGIAKDLIKMSSKSTIKLFVPKNNHSTLFKWVSLLTGSKNTLKGFGFFIGGLLLTEIGFSHSLWLMATSLLVILFITISFLPSNIGGSLAKIKFKKIFSKSTQINFLSLARALLFSSRDIWFVVALPVFLYDILLWDFQSVGGFFALWIIGYGVVQGFTPNIIKKTDTTLIGSIDSLIFWTLSLCILTIILLIAFSQNINTLVFIFGGLGLFGVFFALNSSLHSYLILALTKSDHVALDVGFYYMANAIGRLAGTFLSGIVYQHSGLQGCLSGAFIMIALSSTCVILLKKTMSHS